MMEEGFFEVDVEKVLISKQKDKTKRPSFLLVYLLKKLVHQDEINSFLHATKGLGGYVFFKEALKYLDIKLSVHGQDNYSLEKKYIFVSNHPLGGIDGVSLGTIIGDQYGGKFKYFMNDLLLHLPNVSDIAVPINKYGLLARDTNERIDDALSSDCQLIMFPAGFCSRLDHFELKDIQWKKNFIYSSKEYQRDVVPIFFKGRNSVLFYLIAKVREKLGIKMNYEVILLPHEMFANKGKSFEIYFGKPIPWQTFLDNSKTPLQWAQYVKEEVYKIRDDNKIKKTL